jgi:hypothetical protein
VEEIFLHVADVRFDAALFVWLSHVARTWLEAIAGGKVEVSRDERARRDRWDVSRRRFLGCQ